MTSEQDIIEAIKEAGIPEKVNRYRFELNFSNNYIFYSIF
jgi:hypothetical protein